MLLRIICTVAIACITITNAFARYIPIYIEDNHGGSFYFLAENLDWDKKYHLLLFDQHSDATAISGSDFIRNTLNNYRFGDKNEFYQKWNKYGIIQCYNWIEPLMPHPIQQVTWIYPDKLNRSQKKKMYNKVRLEINSFLEIEERKIMDLSTIYSIKNFKQLQNPLSYATPVVASIDLDYFTDMSPNKAEKEFKNIINYLSQIQNLQCITFAISRPYLKSDKQADQLLHMALKHMTNTINTRIVFEPFTQHLKDRSKLAISYYKQKKQVPYFDIKKASDSLKSFIIKKKKQIHITKNVSAWTDLLKHWEANIFQPHITITNTPNNTFYQLNADEQYAISITNNLNLKSSQINWYILQAEKKSYNIIGDYGFAENAQRMITLYEQKISNQNKPVLLSKHITPFLDREKCGSLHLFAEIIINNKQYRSNTICLTHRKGNSFTGYLSEISNLPYIFGSPALRSGERSSSDLYFGSDCSSFIIYSLRRMGHKIPYVNPKQLKAYLQYIDKVKTINGTIIVGQKGHIALNKKQIDKGVILHFGNHIGAVYKDLGKKNILDKKDLIIHQLEGYPGIIPLGKLKYINRNFEIYFPR